MKKLILFFTILIIALMPAYGIDNKTDKIKEINDYFVGDWSCSGTMYGLDIKNGETQEIEMMKMGDDRIWQYKYENNELYSFNGYEWKKEDMYSEFLGTNKTKETGNLREIIKRVVIIKSPNEFHQITDITSSIKEKVKPFTTRFKIICFRIK